MNAAFRLFSAFRTMKYLHFKRDQGFTAELNTAVKDLLIEMDIDFDARSSKPGAIISTEKVGPNENAQGRAILGSR